MARSREGERGAALLVVMVAVTILTALAVDLAYQTSRSLRIAANARDELQATYQAKSGVALSRLVLSLQQKLDTAITPGAAQASLARPQIWNLVQVSSDLAGRMFGGGAAALPEGSAAGPGPGGFQAEVSDEGTKVNVQLDALGQSSPLLAPQVKTIWQLVCDSKWDALFDREDENGMRASRQDLLVYLRDWVDDNAVGSSLDAAIPPGGCAILTPQNPFPDGFQDENYWYDRGEDRYRAKNARMDSLGELHLVAGVTDAFMAAFGDQLTVYLPRDTKPNLNTTDAARLSHFARIAADPPSQPGLDDPEFPGRLHTLVVEHTLGGFLSLPAKDFADLMALAGVTVNRNAVAAGASSLLFEGTSTVFRIRAVGRAGDVQKTITAVLWYKPPVAGQPAPPVPGKLVHWREE